MPSDGTGFSYGVVRRFEEMLDFFGPDGERWTQHEQVSDNGNRCLIGALRGSRAKLKMKRQDKAAIYLRAAIRNHQNGERLCIIDFNDDRRRTFEDIRFVLLKARAMAIKRDPSYRDDRQLEFSFSL